MKNLSSGVVVVVVATVLGLASSARAEEWSKTFQLNGKAVLAVETSDADIHVDTWEQNTIEARVTTDNWKIGDGGIKISEQQAGNAVNIQVRFPHEFGNIGLKRRRVDIEIRMPHEGTVNLRTSDGSIELHHLKGAMELQSGDGHLDIDGVEGTLHAHTGDGRIHAAGRFDGLNAMTGDGRIDAQALSGSTMQSDWRIQSGDGAVALQLPETFAADIELRTGDGQITLDFPLSVEGKIGGNDIRGKLNGGGKMLTVFTGDGSIRLEKLSSVL